MKQVRTTTAKTHVQELLVESDHALSQLELQERSAGICDRVTIYRILDRLMEEGAIHKTIGLDGVARFASCKKCETGHHHAHNHVHFSCQKCMEVTCLENVIPDFKLPRRYKMLEANYTISGICPKCN